jgi:lysophospholipase L1-like esterase
MLRGSSLAALVVTLALVGGGAAATAQTRASGAASAPVGSGRTATASRYRVLFVGNSYTRFHAMPLMVRAALRSLAHRPEVAVESVARPGWTLSRHLDRGLAVRRIEQGRYTHVVLQGHSLSAVREAGELRQAARALDALSRARGARTVLYETWARRADAPEYQREGLPRTPEQMHAQIADTYGALSRELGAPIAPAGRAFLLAREALPEVELYRWDGSHPSEEGSYLAACTLAGVLSGEDPRGVRYQPPGISRRLAARLREVAAQAIAAGP